MTADGMLLKAVDNAKNHESHHAAKKAANDVKSGSKSVQEIQWTNHGYKHVPQKNLSWKQIVESTRHGVARYRRGLDIETWERMAWEKGIPTTNGRDWKVLKSADIIGAASGMETQYVRVEMSANTIHGRPITLDDYRDLLK